jgi:myo-inositol catabolism protein IolC
MVAAARRDGRRNVGCIILGRGEDDRRVHECLQTAAPVSGFRGFAVGRTAFWEPVVGWRDKENIRDAAVDEVARRYRDFVTTFERAHLRAGGEYATAMRWKETRRCSPARTTSRSRGASSIPC